MHQAKDAVIASDPDFSVEKFSCLDDHTGWFEGYQHAYQIVLVRKGIFRVRSCGAIFEVDRTTCYLGVPGEPRQYAHPVSGELSTVITVSPRLWRSMAGDTPISRYRVYADARIELTHRAILAARPDPGYALTERLLGLLGGVVSGASTRALPVHVRPTPTDRALAENARAAIMADHPAASRLSSLAALLDCSPYRLSRAFSRELGVSLTHYRNRVRITRALDRLEAGEPSLAALAADLGFADQAHLTRTVRDHLDHTPSTLRRLLAAHGLSAAESG
ncbi:helix-turn-helix domain-containing protein [Fodinicola feengrottensis]|uniref:Helix-turn-helix transcriptional regulator n=1 Tax=Fodinicola feengrottensis TaxID=435914 RepID=A0ABP4S0G7_9ACTN|nr:helix-turn-helix transcriptional regulator [Fodinicola feengrottensis]